MKRITIFMMALLMVSAASVQAELVGRWSFNGDALDSSGYGNNGTVYEAAYVAGFFGQALSFDGDDDYVEVDNGGSLDLATAITIEAWVFLEGYGLYSPNYPSFVCKGDVGNYDESYALYHCPGGQLAFLLNRNGTTGGRTAFETSSSIPLSTWTHVAGTYDGTWMKLYIDGSFDRSLPHSGGIYAPAGPVMIGQSYRLTFPGGSTTVDGLIDEVRIWDEALTELPSVLVIEVEIDIKPGSDPNPVNPGSNGLIPVAILTTDDFDAADVDPGTVALAGRGVAVRGKAEKLMARLEDVDGDGDDDLIVQVETDVGLGETWESGPVELTGQTYGGQAIVGHDDVIVVPPE